MNFRYISLAALVVGLGLAVSGCFHAPIVQTNTSVKLPPPGAQIATDLEVHRLSIGEYDTYPTQLFPPRVYCGTDPATHASGVCGARIQQMWHVATQAGNKCGYNYYIFVCKKP